MELYYGTYRSKGFPVHDLMMTPTPPNYKPLPNGHLEISAWHNLKILMLRLADKLYGSCTL